jgi:hypothetical protein
MLAKPLLSHILADDALTRGLGDAEARVLIEWLVVQAEQLASRRSCESSAWEELRKLCRRCRAIGRFVVLWCHRELRGPAGQLAAAERFTWPLPATAVDPYDLMQFILDCESAQLSRQIRPG